MDPTTLERLGIAYIRRRTFESKILAAQVVVELGRAMKPPSDDSKATAGGKKPKAAGPKIPGSEMLRLMGVDVNSP